MKFLILFLVLFSIHAFAQTEVVPVNFNLAQVQTQNSFEFAQPAARITETKYDVKGVAHKQSLYLYAAPSDQRILGLSQTEALEASKDRITNLACSPYHIQGDIANRWCHASIALGVSGSADQLGASSAVSGASGTTVLFLKELTDVHMSSSDVAYTYEARTGRRSKVTITVFGDSLFDSHFKKVKPFDGSTPFISFTRAFGPSHD